MRHVQLRNQQPADAGKPVVKGGSQPRSQKQLVQTVMWLYSEVKGTSLAVTTTLHCIQHIVIGTQELEQHQVREVLRCKRPGLQNRCGVS